MYHWQPKAYTRRIRENSKSSKEKAMDKKIIIALNQSTFEKLKIQLLQETLPDKQVHRLA